MSRSRVGTVAREVRRRRGVGRVVEGERRKVGRQGVWDGRVDQRLGLGTRTTAVDALEVDIRVPRRWRGHRASLLLAVDAEADAVAAHFRDEENRI